MMESKAEPDFFDSSFGLFTGEWRKKGGIKDFLFDLRLRVNSSRLTLRSKMKTQPGRRILAVGIEMPGRVENLKKIMQSLSCTRHDVATLFIPFQEGMGKFQHINAVLKSVSLNDYDWLVIVDDDVVLSDRFLDAFICLAESANLHIGMPAHRFRSFQSFKVTLRHWNSLARVTHFVECGPLTAFRRSVFPYVLPFPDSRWAWGTDIVWSEIARNLNLPIGVVDATPIRHIRPVSSAYDKHSARDEAHTLLKNFNIIRKRHEILRTVETIYAL